jgi:hypothetical protein
MDVLQLDTIKLIPEDAHNEGGIKNLSNFKEGSCFLVSTEVAFKPFKISLNDPIPQKANMNKWLICLDDESEKNKLMELLIRLKLKRQHDVGIYLNMNEIKKLYLIRKNADSVNTDKVTNSNDGYWVVLKDWSTCSKACGGGIQTLQLSCIPPKINGKPCFGPDIRTRSCNTNQCPIVSDEEGKESEVKSEKKLPVIVKAMSISKRKNRYDKCYLKESDALMVKDDESTRSLVIKPKIPVRVVLNDKTFTIYQDDVFIFLYRP